MLRATIAVYERVPWHRGRGVNFCGLYTLFSGYFKRQNSPAYYSWSLWGLLTILLIALQIKGGAGPATWVTAAAGLMCLGVILLSLKHGKRYITVSDTVTAILSLAAMAFWLLADQPVVSMFLVIAADLLAFIPTVRKSWNKPYTETLSLYVTNALRFSLAVLAVQEYTLLSTLWLVVWAAANGSFSIMLIVRRKQVKASC